MKKRTMRRTAPDEQPAFYPVIGSVIYSFAGVRIP